MGTRTDCANQAVSKLDFHDTPTLRATRFLADSVRRTNSPDLVCPVFTATPVFLISDGKVSQNYNFTLTAKNYRCFPPAPLLIRPEGQFSAVPLFGYAQSAAELLAGSASFLQGSK